MATKEEIKALATKAELKAEQDKIVKLQTCDWNLFIGQSCFNNDAAQLCLIFQPSYKTITSSDTWSRDWNTYFTLKDCLFQTVKIT